MNVIAKGDTLVRCFQRATQGACQVVLVSGEVGVGKTTVVEVGLARLASESGIWLAREQCGEHYGEGEPYVHLGLLAVGGYRQRNDLEHARTHPFGDGLDGTALARRIAALEYDDAALPSALDPVLQSAQLHLKLANFFS